MTRKPANSIFLKVDLPADVMAELDESIAYYGCWRSRAAFIREVVERWLLAWREREDTTNPPHMVSTSCETDL